MRKGIMKKGFAAISLSGVLTLTFCLSGLPVRAQQRTLAVGDDEPENGNASGTITLSENRTTALTVAADEVVTLDLNGYELSATVTNNGTLTVTDSKATGAIRVASATAATTAITNNGTLTIDGANIYNTGSGSLTANAIVNNGTLTYLGGETLAISQGSGYGFGIYNTASGTIKDISGGSVASILQSTASGSNAVAISNEGTIEKITGGELNASVSGTGYATAVRNRKSIGEISGGSFTATLTETASNSANFAVTIFNESGSCRLTEISGGTLTAVSRGKGYAAAVRNASGCTVETVSGGELYALVDNAAGTDATLAFGIYNSGTLGSVAGGTIKGESRATQWAFGIRNDGTITTISGGAIISVVDHGKNAPNAIAVCNDKTIGSITGGTFYAYSTTPSGSTIGIRTRNAGSTIGSLSGGAVRINKQNDAHYFYDEGGGVTTYAAGYALSAVTSNQYRYVLGSGETVSEEYRNDDKVMTGTVKNASAATVKEYTLIGTEIGDSAAIGNAQYESVNAAIAASATGDTVVVLKDLEENITVPAGKSVTVDLNGHRVVGSVVNNGTLEFADSVGTGLLYKSTSASGLDPLIANYGTLVYGDVTARIDGIGAGPEADGIYNYAGATLTVTGGTLRAIAYGTKWAHAIVNAGTIEDFRGNFQTLALDSENASNIVALANSGEGVVKSVSGGVLYAQTAGKGGTAIGIRTQGNSSVESVSGGVVKAVVNSATGGSAEAYAVYTESATSSVTIEGGELSAVSYTDYAFGVFNKGTVNVTGGRISAAALHNTKAPNVIALSNETGTANVSGGYLSAYSVSEGGGTYAIRNRGTLGVSGGAFEINKLSCDHIFTEGGTTNYAEGVSLREMQSQTVKYAARDTDVVVEQLDGASFIGVDVFRDGNALYAYHVYERDGYYLDCFYSAEEDAKMIEKDKLNTLSASATVYAAYEKAPLYYFLGSSVTYGHANNGSSFVNEIANMLGCVCVKEAVSGTTLANNGSGSYVARMLSNLDKNAKVEHLIVQLSTNDVSQSVTRGKISDTKNIEEIDNTTTLGAIEFIIAYAKMTWGCEVTFYTNPDYNNEAYESLVQDLYLIQEKWGIGILDFYYYKDMEELDSATLSSYMADAIHPNAMGYRWMGEVFSAYLAKLYAENHNGAKI